MKSPYFTRLKTALCPLHITGKGKPTARVCQRRLRVGNKRCVDCADAYNGGKGRKQ